MYTGKAAAKPRALKAANSKGSLGKQQTLHSQAATAKSRPSVKSVSNTQQQKPRQQKQKQQPQQEQQLERKLPSKRPVSRDAQEASRGGSMAAAKAGADGADKPELASQPMDSAKAAAAAPAGKSNKRMQGALDGQPAKKQKAGGGEKPMGSACSPVPHAAAAPQVNLHAH